MLSTIMYVLLGIIFVLSVVLVGKRVKRKKALDDKMAKDVYPMW